MLIYHEGLPRSGKSYEAMVRQVLPAVKEGRPVFARVNGIDHERIAEIAGLPVERVRELVHELTDEQCREIWKHVKDDALVVIDEVHTYWPADRSRRAEGARPEVLKFFAEHGHHGLDIVTMGQVLADVHPVIRRRVDRKIQFETRDVVGRPTDYTWRAFKLRDPKAEKWELVSTGKGTYDPAFFGMYKTRVSETTRSERLGDDRIVIWKRPMVKYGIPAVLVLTVVGIGGMVWAFSGGILPDAKPAQPKPAEAQQIKPQQPGAQVPAPVVQAPAPAVEEPLDPFEEVLRAGRPRFSGSIRSMDGKRFDGFVEIIDKDQDTVRERFRLSWAEDLGWGILFHSWGITAMKGPRIYRIATWPRDESKRGLDASPNGSRVGAMPNRASDLPSHPTSSDPAGAVPIPGATIGPGRPPSVYGNT